MTVIPFLDKNDKVQSKELNNLFLKSDFLLLPTRSEAYGVVFCEANAFGLPVITTDTGGVSSVIESGKNGFMLPINAKGIDYAKLIKDIYMDDEKYYGLVLSSRETFEEKLNWDSWAKTVCKLINRIV
jgi:glycosyltransferase involved in cell wall biosynthesis